MRIGATEKVQIEDLTFHVSRARGPRKAYREAITHAGYDPTKPAEEQAEVIAKLGDAVEDLVAAVVVGVDGIEDADGKPVPWTRAILDELPEDVYEDLASAVQRGRRSEVEEGNAGAASP